MGIDSFRLAISLNRYTYACPEKYEMHTELIIGGNSSANIVVSGSSLFGDFAIL